MTSYICIQRADREHVNKELLAADTNVKPYTQLCILVPMISLLGMAYSCKHESLYIL